jgi:hypothetical protein
MGKGQEDLVETTALGDAMGREGPFHFVDVMDDDI